MPIRLRDHDPQSLCERLRSAPVMTHELMKNVITEACRRMPSTGQHERSARVARLIEAEAWADAALGLIELELPMWRVRRIVYDEGEWHCALSRERELPDWLDAAVETHHADLALALLCAFTEVKATGAEVSRPSVPSVRTNRDLLYQPLACENFG
jgi:hypothetical protein